MSVKTTVYLEEEDLKNLKKKLIDEGINLSEKFREWVKKYLEKSQVTIQPKVVDSSELNQDLTEVAKEIFSTQPKGGNIKIERCPHYIAKGGHCVACGGIAK